MFRQMIIAAVLLFCTSPAAAQQLPAPQDVLPQLFSRNHHKPYELLFTNGRFPSERTIFRDPVSHLEIWKMTHDPEISIRPYYDIPFWNADGSKMLIQTWRPTGLHAYIMDADGETMTAVKIPGHLSKKTGVTNLFWSDKDPAKMFFSAPRGDKTYILAWNVETDEVTDVTWIDKPDWQVFPPHPDEEVFLVTRGRQDQEGVQAALVHLDPSKNSIIPISRKSYHRVRFTKGDDYSIFFNSNEYPQGAYFIHADGTGLVTLRGERPEEHNRRGSHPDFSHDGKYFSVVENGYVEFRDRTGKNIRRIGRINGGHGSFAYGDQFQVWEVGASSNPADSPHEGEVIMMSTVEYPKIWTVAKHFTRHQGWGGGHPYTESTHIDPTASKDLTKIGYMSDMAGQFSDIYIATVMYPDPPQFLTVSRSGASAELLWEPPEQRAEIKGYHIYRSTQSGRLYRRVNRDIVTGTAYRDSDLAEGRAYFYYVVAQEHSSLQGQPSNEVCASPSGRWEGPAVVDAEIENGVRSADMVDDLDGRFSNNFYVKLREYRDDGTVTVTVSVPKDGDYTLYTLAKSVTSRPVYWVNVDNRSSDLILYEDAIPARNHSGFNWTAAPATYRLSQGEHTIRYRVNTEGIMLDKLILTDDPAYIPAGDGRRDSAPPAIPRGGEAETLGLWTLGLSWDPVTDLDVHHYNIYSGRTPDFPVNQDHLLLSPSKPEIIDWGLQSSSYQYTGTTYYYRVTAVDYDRNESVPSRVFEGRIQVAGTGHVRF